MIPRGVWGQKPTVPRRARVLRPLNRPPTARRTAPAAYLDVQMALGGEVLQHLVRVVYRERGLHRRLRGRQLAAPLQGLQEFALPGVGDGGLVGALGETRDTPYQQPEGGEDHPPEHEDQPPQALRKREHEDPDDGDRDEHGEAGCDLRAGAHLVHLEPEEIVRVPPLVAVSSVTGLYIAVRSLLHRLASGLNIPARLGTDHAPMRDASVKRAREA